MKIKILKTESEYNEACERIYELIHSTEKEILPESNEGEEIDLLSLLVEDYEKRMNHRLKSTDAIEAIKIRMKERHLKQVDLIKFIGNKSTVSKILRKQRSLTLDMVKTLSKELDIPVETLVGY